MTGLGGRRKQGKNHNTVAKGGIHPKLMNEGFIIKVTDISLLKHINRDNKSPKIKNPTKCTKIDGMYKIHRRGDKLNAIMFPKMLDPSGMSNMEGMG